MQQLFIKNKKKLKLGCMINVQIELKKFATLRVKFQYLV